MGQGTAPTRWITSWQIKLVIQSKSVGANLSSTVITANLIMPIDLLEPRWESGSGAQVRADRKEQRSERQILPQHSRSYRNIPEATALFQKLPH